MQFVRTAVCHMEIIFIMDFALAFSAHGACAYPRLGSSQGKLFSQDLSYRLVSRNVSLKAW